MKTEILLLFCVLQIVFCNISSKLFYYETLYELEEVKRVRRSLDGANGHVDKDVKFNAFGRSFLLVLENNADILSGDFTARVQKKDGSSSRININKNEFFQGYLAGDTDSSVDAFLEDGIWTANIYTKQDSYHIEPSWRHLPRSKYHKHIVYRGSDVKHNITNSRKLFDGIKVNVDPKDIIFNHKSKDRDSWHRQKRQSWISGANSCQLYVVVDHLFHQGIGGGHPHTTVNYIINTFQAVNNIFRSTLWEELSDLYDIGFQIGEMKIYETATAVNKGEQHYNMHMKNGWDTRDLLEIFSREAYHANFCLAHLFTYQKFSGGVLGLAYIASPRQRTVGGICSPSYMKNKKRLTLNSGWSSSMNTNGDRLLTLEANLVTAHELGHNWGSEHDAETDECAPSSVTDKGKYIMYPYAVKGYEDNNKVFSPCSKRYIADVLKAKAFNCFTARVVSAPYCGNGIIDVNEECDGGRTGKEGNDPCCSSDCKLIGSATCSNMNYECCDKCKMAKQGVVCREAFTGGCFLSAKCDGFTMSCPSSLPKNESTPCLEGGKCYDGECKSFCALNNAEPCRCENEDACYRCCKGSDGQCRKFGNEKLPEGRACYVGFCDNDGVCKNPEQNLVERLFSFIEKLTPNAFVEFMRRNIVGTVIVFSMLIWIPASWGYSCVDKKREEEERKLSQWRSMRSNDFFQSDAYPIKLRNSQRHRVPRHALSVRQPMIVNRPNPKLYRDKHQRGQEEATEERDRSRERRFIHNTQGYDNVTAHEQDPVEESYDNVTAMKVSPRTSRPGRRRDRYSEGPHDRPAQYQQNKRIYSDPQRTFDDIQHIPDKPFKFPPGQSHMSETEL